MRREIDAKIWRTGNSFVITIPLKIGKKWGLRVGSEITVIIKRNALEALDLKGRGTENVLRTNPSSKEGRRREV